MPPLVSIGLPFYNAEDTIGLAIRSVFAQTIDDWELTLLDDGSTDDSARIAASVGDSRVRLVRDGRNRGLTARLNELTALSHGRYIARMDADDIMHPERLARQLAVFERHPGVNVVVSASYLMDSQEEVYGVDSIAPLGEGREMYLRATNTWFAHPTVTARAGWMQENLYDERFRLGQEKELFCRTYDQIGFAKVAAPLLFYREAGTVRLTSYRAQRRVDRQLLRMYGRDLVGTQRTLALMALTSAKEAIYVGAFRVGVGDRLASFIARARAAEVSGSELARAASVLAAVRETPVPGLAAER